MSLFDTVYSGYHSLQSGEHVVFQTKDLDEACFSYWLDPDGRLYHIDSSNCFDMHWPEGQRLPTWAPNGNKMKLSPTTFTCTARLVGENRTSHVLFSDGRVFMSFDEFE